MKILVDADSCPQKAREIIIRCANRLEIQAIFAANRPIPGIEIPFKDIEEKPTKEVKGIPLEDLKGKPPTQGNLGRQETRSNSFAVMEICETGEGAADNRLIELAETGDLVITRDIPLAQELVEKKVTVMNDRGREYNNENIRQALSLRNFSVGLADSGLGIERIASYGKKDIKNFADSLDRILTRLKR